MEGSRYHGERLMYGRPTSFCHFEPPSSYNLQRCLQQGHNLVSLLRLQQQIKRQTSTYQPSSQRNRFTLVKMTIRTIISNISASKKLSQISRNGTIEGRRSDRPPQNFAKVHVRTAV